MLTDCISFVNIFSKIYLQYLATTSSNLSEATKCGHRGRNRRPKTPSPIPLHRWLPVRKTQ